ncbi:UDP-3-O-[3-hydroxymyristoyl] N-acetylglucosamine deacetylase [Galdieria sulphuraria]|uniref:UDP-3-O-acyl-N-acetylglucosamine deacetylase n=1 Tax=Galdieria sulphuraria TaxID=130081 RepID=M2Y9K8_GALSU|nr:UDP-3-O-[3-hydroxymyristoyl] N-acetylglucosamine deacetylase [Galdieria sulphuraria]EME32559.1 UDP-3-O-[3-hydroxymyristoyl] N-acetylglucosamine deacetylase [Galdieria sulphuraria]|eukprot:XP_005709079.1 UDP-3-O-[3-hydroxymyristoyl] N-acetylglucosamine deacetylase [Galdieria sulphuraria]
MSARRRSTRPCCFAESAIWIKAHKALGLTTSVNRALFCVSGKRTNPNITKCSSSINGTLTYDDIQEEASCYSLNESVTFQGNGLHSGEEVSVTVSPTRNFQGISFLYEDKNGMSVHVPLKSSSVVSTELCTTISAPGNPLSRIATVEHLLAALWGCGVGSAVIKVEGNEIPILDGSAIHFVEAFEKVGYRRFVSHRDRIYQVQQPICVQDERGSWARLEPPKDKRGLTVEVTIDFPHNAIGKQTFQTNSAITKDIFIREIAAARTFCLETDIEKMKGRKLCKGGSLDNAVVFSRHGDGILNEGGLRFPDEPVRHKVLDVLGDLFISGVFVVGHYSAYKPGHRLNSQLVRLLERKIEQEREKLSVSEEHLTNVVVDPLPLAK